MNPITIDITGAIAKGQAHVIAYGSTYSDRRDRWTELSVFHFPEGLPGAKCWVAEVSAHSLVEGERTKRRRMASASLERAMCIIEDSDLGITVRETALEYAEQHGLPMRKPGGQVVPDGEREALAWLYGIEPGEVSINAVAKDLDTGESTIRTAIADGRPVKIPLRALLPFIDRFAFRDFINRQRENDRG